MITSLIQIINISLPAHRPGHGFGVGGEAVRKGVVTEDLLSFRL